MLRLRPVRKPDTEQRGLRVERAEAPSLHGAELEAARVEDASWRAQRRTRARRTLRKLEAVYEGTTDFLARMGLMLGLTFVAGMVCFLLALSPVGFGWARFGIHLTKVAISGIAVLIVLGGSCWLARGAAEALFRKWAEQQVIDLEPPPEEAD